MFSRIRRRREQSSFCACLRDSKVDTGKDSYRNIEYYIFDPTGNITALVESYVPEADQPAAAAEIMNAEPSVEQVGFVSYADEAALSEGNAPVSLRMAGGEFCGNATMCAAALFAVRSGLQSGAVPVKVSGASAPLTVKLEQQAAREFSAAVNMPPAKGIETLPVTEGAANAVLPIVKMEGISHIIVEPGSEWSRLKDDKELAESCLRQWCSETGAECLGIMFLGEKFTAAERSLTPLVYVPGADTMFWENSCASGSTAAGMYLAAKAGTPVDVTFDEPAGQLRVESDPDSGKTILHGSAILRK